MKHLERIVLLPLLALMCSCNFNATYIDRESDIARAHYTIAKFYELVQTKQYEKTYSYYSPKFLAVTDTSKIRQIYETCFEKFGTLRDYTLEEGHSKVVVGTKPRGEYTLSYTISHTLHDSKEKFYVIEEDGKIQIMQYQVESPLFSPSN